jgi:hypothetical protein
VRSPERVAPDFAGSSRARSIAALRKSRYPQQLHARVASSQSGDARSGRASRHMAQSVDRAIDLHAELAAQRKHALLSFAKPRAAHRDDGSVGRRPVPDPTADAIMRLERHDQLSGALQPPRSCKAGESRANYAIIRLQLFRGDYPCPPRTRRRVPARLHRFSACAETPPKCSRRRLTGPRLHAHAS